MMVARGRSVKKFARYIQLRLTIPVSRFEQGLHPVSDASSSVNAQYGKKSEKGDITTRYRYSERRIKEVQNNIGFMVNIGND